MSCTKRRFRWNDGRIKAAGSFLSPLLPPMPCDVWKGYTEADTKSTVHMSPYLQQHKHRSSVIRGGTDLSFSYLFTQILSITLFCPLSISLFMHFSVFSKQVSTISTSCYSFWRILGRACPHACLSAWPAPDSPLHGWKNERLTAGQLAPYVTCVCVNRSETATLPSSESEAYTSGVSKRSHGDMHK